MVKPAKSTKPAIAIATAGAVAAVIVIKPAGLAGLSCWCLMRC